MNEEKCEVRAAKNPPAAFEQKLRAVKLHLEEVKKSGVTSSLLTFE